MTADIAASIRARLRNLARERGEAVDLVHVRYANQRLLQRLTASGHRERFLLKGATLFLVWSEVPHRPTRDLDMLGFGESDPASMEALFKSLCDRAPAPDGLHFLADSVRAATIRDAQEYTGVRVTLTALLGRSRIPVQVDVGFGDDVFPPPREFVLPGLLGFPELSLRAYPPEAVIAEKTQAMVDLGMANSRMKDFYDVMALAEKMEFRGDVLTESLRRTFSRRRTVVPASPPLALTPAFSTDREKQIQWEAFKGRHGLLGPSLVETVETLCGFLLPPLRAAAGTAPVPGFWTAGGPWDGPLSLPDDEQT